MSGKIMLTGLKKVDYFRVIKERGTNNSMRFPVIFLESCRSELSEDLLSQLRGESTPLIGSLYTSNETGLRFTTIDYPQLLKQSAEKDQNLATALVDHLAEIQSTQVPIPTE
jgi:hypothetical protein